MTDSPATPWVCTRDFARRSSVTAFPRHVLVAKHLADHQLLQAANDLLADIRAGRSLNRHLSPMKKQRAVFKRANRKQDWANYRRFMDHLLNKWGFYHFHCDRGSVLIFVHFCDTTATARVLDFVPHDGNWLVEKRLVEIAIRNWPEAKIAQKLGVGTSQMTELDLFKARKQGLNMMVNVDGVFFLPAQSALMSDGSGYAGRILAPIGVVARKYNPNDDRTNFLNSPHTLVVGADPDDPSPPWELAATVAGMLAARSRLP